MSSCQPSLPCRWITQQRAFRAERCTLAKWAQQLLTEPTAVVWASVREATPTPARNLRPPQLLCAVRSTSDTARRRSSTVARWQEEGVFDQLNSLLRRQVRRQEGHEGEPIACVIDSQSIKPLPTYPPASRASTPGRRSSAVKRSIVVDTVGLLLTAASVQGSVAGRSLVEQVAAEYPSVRKTWVDGGYRQHLVEHAATLGIERGTASQSGRAGAARCGGRSRGEPARVRRRCGVGRVWRA
jgi:hypothetical protein